MTIAFDCDGCLIDKEGVAINENVALLKVLSKRYKVFVWSGNNWQYVWTVVINLGIQDHIHGVLNKYNTFTPDIVFDDQEINLGKLNICTK